MVRKKINNMTSLRRCKPVRVIVTFKFCFICSRRFSGNNKSTSTVRGIIRFDKLSNGHEQWSIRTHVTVLVDNFFLITPIKYRTYRLSIRLLLKLRTVRFINRFRHNYKPFITVRIG